MATIYDIAKLCNCSTTTVSKVLNNRGNISSTKSKEILQTAAKLGYVRSHSAMSLASSNGSSHLIGVYLHIKNELGFTHELFSKILNSFRIVVEKKGYDICFLRDLSDSDPYQYENLIRSRGIDGAFIFTSSKQKNPKISKLFESNIPVVSFDILSSKYYVTTNNKESVHQMVDYLVKMGHTRISYVNPDESDVSLKRLKGFKEGLAANNIAFDEKMVVHAPYYGEGNAKEATDLALQSGINPTAIMYPDDYTAVASIPYLRSLGYKVPDDISITGFDGLDIASVVHPSITTTKQEPKDLGQKAAELLLKQIKGQKIRDGENHIIVPSTLLKGETVKDISGGNHK